MTIHEAQRERAFNPFLTLIPQVTSAAVKRKIVEAKRTSRRRAVRKEDRAIERVARFLKSSAGPVCSITIAARLTDLRPGAIGEMLKRLAARGLAKSVSTPHTRRLTLEMGYRADTIWWLAK